MGHTPGLLHVEVDRSSGIYEVQTKDGRTVGTAFCEEDALLWASAPELLEGCSGTLRLLRKAQDVLTTYLTPDGYDADRAVELLLELLDGPEQRAIEAPAHAAILKAKPTP